MAPRTGPFAAALFLGALLLFLLQPMFGRLVLPALGGAPAVWNTCLVFFQLTLLAGYLYAWASARWLRPRAQLGLQAAIAVAALGVLPIRIVPAWLPPAEASPVPWLLAVLALSIGLPFFVLSTTSPVLQHWFSRTDHPEAADPYFLYRASNLGSMAGLVAYPLVADPWLGLEAQGLAWSAGYVAFGLVLAACGSVVLRRPAMAPAANGSAAGYAGAGWKTILRWITLAAIPSSLLLGVTTTLSTDVAVVPLLWVAPLVLYLGTCVVAFSRRPVVSLRVATIALPLLVVPVAVAMIAQATEPVWIVAPLHLAAFTAMALVCHSRLAAERPHADGLTLFYLCLAIGGAIGGLFNALVAPVVFPVPVEYPLAIVAACLIKPYRDVPVAAARPAVRDVLYPAALAAAMVALILATRRIGGDLEKIQWLLGLGIPAFACFVFSARPVRFGLGIAVLFAASMARPSQFGAMVDVERSFFGVHRVYTDAGRHLRVLFHGSTMHGVQSLDPARSRDPLAYYSRGGPIGQVFEGFPGDGPRDVAVVGLGAGALAGYARAGQSWTFFEIDPVVVTLARDAGHFTYLANAPAAIEVVVGDARSSLARHARTYDLVILDAFSSDAVPVHLLTREALQVYLSRLKPGGVLAFHVSNRFLRLRRLFAALAPDAGLAHLRQADLRREPTGSWTGRLPSEWILLARSREDLRALRLDERWAPVVDTPVRVWTDDYSNLFALLRWR